MKPLGSKFARTEFLTPQKRWAGGGEGGGGEGQMFTNKATSGNLRLEWPSCPSHPDSIKLTLSKSGLAAMPRGFRQLGHRRRLLEADLGADLDAHPPLLHLHPYVR